MQKRNKQASVLLVALVILGIVLAAALSVSMASLMNEKMSLGANKSNLAFQMANTGIERTLQLIKDNQEENIGSIDNDGNCNGIVKNTNYEVELRDGDGNRITDCAKSVSEIVSIKSTGTSGQNQRAVSIKVIQNKIQPNSDLMIALDYSSSMSSDDLLKEKKAAKNLIKNLNNQSDSQYRVGVVYFAHDTIVQSLLDLSSDSQMAQLNKFIDDGVVATEDGTNTAKAISDATDELVSGSNNRYESNPQSIVFITDGVPYTASASTDDSIDCSPDGFWNITAAENAITASTAAKDDKINIITIGVGLDNYKDDCQNKTNSLMREVASNYSSFISIDAFKNLENKLNSLIP